MNPKTLGIFAGAAAICGVALFLVVKGGGGTTLPPPPPPPPLDNPNTPTPQSDVTFGDRVKAHATLSQSYVLSATSSEVFLNVDLTAAAAGGARQPFSAALVIDRSGSMAGAKIDSARDAALGFLQRLRDDDQIAIVTYGSDVSADLSLSRVGNVRGQAQRIIASIDAGGGTNISGGLNRAIRELSSGQGARRVMLISDGRPTEGERSPQRLAAIAGDGRETGLSFSSLGVGLDYDENVMEGIALRGGGGFYHLRRAHEMANILGKEFKAVETMVASSVRLRVAPGPRIQISEVFGYDLSREGNAVVIHLGDLSQGEQRRLVARATLNAGAPALESFANLGLTYRVPATGSGESASAGLSIAATNQAQLVTSSFKPDVVVAAHKVEAQAAVQESMRSMAKQDRGAAVAKIQRAKARLYEAAKAAPAAAAPALQAEAEAFGAMEQKAADVSFDSDDGKDWVKSTRARSFSSQRE